MKIKIINLITFLITAITISISTPSNAAHWVYVPSTPNELKKGDIILTKDPDGILTPIFDTFGYIWDHTLMAIDDNGTLRHNTMRFTNDLQESAIMMKKYTFRVYDKFGNILLMRKTFSLPEKIDETLLKGLPPGIINSRRSPGKYRVRLTTTNEDKRQSLEEVANEMIKMEGYYILNSFINMEAYEPTYDNLPAAHDKGGHCSGTIWWANKRNGITMNVPIKHEPELILQAATKIHKTFVKYFTDMLTEEINNEIDSYKGAESEKFNNMFTIYLYLAVSYLEDYIIDDFKDQIKHHLFSSKKIPQRFANQIVNTFLFNRTDDNSDYWKHNYENIAISSVSPDNLLMAGMPDLNGNFNGEQTSNSSLYDAIEDYTESGGYYIKISEGENDAPVNPLLSGESPEIMIISHESKPVQNSGEYLTEFEIVPIEEELGGKNSKKFYFDIKNLNLVTPLELDGNPPIRISGDNEFEIIKQPEVVSIPGGGKTAFGIKFSFEPESPGDYSTLVSIPNSDPNKGDYKFTFKVKGINKSYFWDEPIYYNQCDSEESLKTPLIGAQFNQEIIENSNGAYLYREFPVHKFNNGFMIGHGGRDKKNYKQALIYPFGNQQFSIKPDLTVGTCSFWVSSRGTWRKKGDDTYIHAWMDFFLTDDTYVKVYSASYPETSDVFFIIDGKLAFSGLQFPEGTIINITLQWDFIRGFDDGSNIKLYCNSEFIGSFTSVHSGYKINDTNQYFDLITKTANEGDYGPTGSHSTIDNILFWNKIIDTDEMFLSLYNN